MVGTMGASHKIITLIAITLENETLKRLDMLVKSNLFPNRSKAIQEAVAEKLARKD
jgi:metal-responsive CopG/Arc/MetJ family transcriptional regulator